jgi:ribosomal protein S18 acetylase RimI-like enzyme
MSTPIRTAFASDLSTLIALSRRTISASYRSFLGDQAVDAFLDSGAADQYVADNMERCTVLMCDGEIAGFSVCRDNTIDLMMVDCVRHRQGFGTKLLRHVEEALFQRYDELRLESFEANEKANAFYRKNGWRETRRYFDRDASVRKIVFQRKASGR